MHTGALHQLKKECLRLTHKAGKERQNDTSGRYAHQKHRQEYAIRPNKENTQNSCLTSGAS